MRRLPSAIAALVACGVAASAHAGPDDRATVRGWIERIRAELAAARPVVRTPPIPIKVTWSPRRLASVNIGAPLLALIGGDLDGDHRAELYAITEREIVAFDVGARLVERARIALPADPAAIRPRDAVATAYIERGAKPELRVKASTRARGARYGWDGKALRELGPIDEFPLCAGKVMALVPGRDHFGTVAAPVHGVRCRDDLVDREGTPLAVTAELGAGGALAVSVTPQCPGCARGDAPPPYTGAPVAVTAVGTAFEVADLDRDGTIEVIAAGAGAPGDRDAIKVLPVTATGVEKKPLHRRAFTGGVVAIAVADVDGDGADEVIGAVRLPGTAKVDLWQLNR
jgi:hypothetical protein